MTPKAPIREGALVALLVLLGSIASAASPRLAGCPAFPADNIWNVRIDDLPADPLSATFVETIGADDTLHPDFGAGEWPPGSGSPIGIPWIDVPADQEPVPVTFTYDDESDPGPYPIPPDAPIEGGPASDGDRHVLVVDRDACRLYELFDAHPVDGGLRWEAGSGAVFDLTSNALRPAGWTSADAAGLPILPGLVRYEEVAAGEIRHALRFTAPRTRRDWVWPARHFASDLTDERYPPMGQRFRLRADFDLSGFSPENRVILRALKRYGMILADNGSAWFLAGVPDEGWDNDDLRELSAVRGSDFEAVDVSSLRVHPDSGRTAEGNGDDSTCIPDPTTLCLVDGRFRVTVTWRDFQGNTGPARRAPLSSDDSGVLWFFDPDNWEMLVKVLDGCPVNDHYWVFSAAGTDVEYTLRVEDTATGAVRESVTPSGLRAITACHSLAGMEMLRFALIQHN